MKKKYIIFLSIFIGILLLGGIFYFQKNKSYKVLFGTKLPVKMVSLTKNKETYEIPSIALENGVMYQYKFDNKKSIKLKKGEKLNIYLKVNSKEEEQVALVYEYQDEFTEIFGGGIEKEINTGFTAKEDGNYKIYSVGVSAAETNVTEGKVEVYDKN